MKSVKQKADPAPVRSTNPTQRPCQAFGCPEIGAISHSNAGEAPADSWFCRWHFGEKADRWPEITRQRRMAQETEVFD